jgi:hypothetical protein
LRKHIETFLTLNRAGRGYVKENAMDKIAGTQTLGAVSHNLDCLFYHLSRESPTLCDRTAGSVDNETDEEGDARRKRRRLSRQS